MTPTEAIKEIETKAYRFFTEHNKPLVNQPHTKREMAIRNEMSDECHNLLKILFATQTAMEAEMNELKEKLESLPKSVKFVTGSFKEQLDEKNEKIKSLSAENEKLKGTMQKSDKFRANTVTENIEYEKKVRELEAELEKEKSFTKDFWKKEAQRLEAEKKKAEKEHGYCSVCNKPFWNGKTSGKMSGIKTARKKSIVDTISRIIIHCQNEGRLDTRSDIRRCGKMIYKNLEEVRK